MESNEQTEQTRKIETESQRAGCQLGGVRRDWAKKKKLTDMDNSVAIVRGEWRWKRV